MNAKKAKALRKLAKQVATEAPDKVSQTVQYVINQADQRVEHVEDFDAKGDLVTKIVPVLAGTVEVDPGTTRGIYHHLKKLVPGNK